MKRYIREDIAAATVQALAQSETQHSEWLSQKFDYSDKIPSPGGVTQSIHKQIAVSITENESIELVNELQTLIDILSRKARFEARELGEIVDEWHRLLEPPSE